MTLALSIGAGPAAIPRACGARMLSHHGKDRSIRQLDRFVEERCAVHVRRPHA